MAKKHKPVTSMCGHREGSLYDGCPACGVEDIYLQSYFYHEEIEGDRDFHDSFCRGELDEYPNQAG